ADALCALVNAPARTFSLTERLECHSLARSLAISSKLRPDNTLSGAFSTIDWACANSSLALIKSHDLSSLPPYLLPRVRTSDQAPCSFSPSSSKRRWPLA